MARQRQRARDRKGRGADQPAGNGPADDAPKHPGEIHRANMPGSLDHPRSPRRTSRTTIVAGADGVPLDDAAQAAFGEGAELVPADVAAANAIEDE